MHQPSDSVYERLLAQRVVVIGSDIDEEAANRVSAQILLLASDDPDADVHLYVNSPGGSVTGGLSVYDTMQMVPCDVATCAMGLAAGMGQFLMSAGAPGKRTALPHSNIQLTRAEPDEGTPDDDTRFLRTRRELAETIARHTGQPPGRVQADQDAGRWFTADEAVTYGLVDRVVDRPR